MSDINKIIGRNLLTLRKNKKLTQMELAEHFKYSDKTVSKWEKGESLPSIDVLYELAKFYGVSLDSLTKEEHILRSVKQEKPARDKMFPAHLIIALIAVSAIWVCAVGLYVGFKICLDKNFYIFFMWAVPLSCIILIIFNSIWGKAYVLFFILTAFLWSLLASIYLQFIRLNMWPLFILGVPLQIAIILCAALIKPRKTPKQKKLKDKTKEEGSQTQEQEKMNLSENEEELQNQNENVNMKEDIEVVVKPLIETKETPKINKTQDDNSKKLKESQIKSATDLKKSSKTKSKKLDVPILTEEERSNGGQIKVSFPQIININKDKNNKK